MSGKRIKVRVEWVDEDYTVSKVIERAYPASAFAEDRNPKVQALWFSRMLESFTADLEQLTGYKPVVEEPAEPEGCEWWAAHEGEPWIPCLAERKAKGEYPFDKSTRVEE